MSKFNFSPDLFLEAAELNRFQQFIDQDGFRKNLIFNTVKFGLIKSNKDVSFNNGKVTRDTDNALGQKCIRIANTYAINLNGLLTYLPAQTQLSVPGDGSWYWIRVSHAYSNIEKGKYSIAANGNLTCTTGDGELTKIFRGVPNFPSRIRFTNSVGNTEEYDVLSVVDDNNAIIQHPGIVGGVAQFSAETNLLLRVVGTFSPGVAVSNAQKYPFNYDSALYEIILETTLNTKPTFTTNIHFYLARVRVIGGLLVIQDKRTDIWETKGSELSLSIEAIQANPLIGVEAVKWDHKFSPSCENLVEIAWGMRASNWGIDSSTNTVTLNPSSLGGRFKTTTEFTNGDFNGWRLYTENGSYSRVVNSIKVGTAINLQLDTLDVDNYSSDGGTSFLSQTLLVVPNAEEVELRFTPNPVDGLGDGFIKAVSYPINTTISSTKVLVFKDPSCLYRIEYRYKMLKEYTEWLQIPSDTVTGYLNESSFDIVTGQPTVPSLTTYDSSTANGYVKLTLSTLAYIKFKNLIYKGDLAEVERRVWDYATPTTKYDCVVGFNKIFQIFDYRPSVFPPSPPSFASKALINLPKTRHDGTPCVNGNRWVFWLRDHLAFLNASDRVEFVTDYVNSTTYTQIYRLSLNDVNFISGVNANLQSVPYQGLRLEFVYDGTKWDLDHTNEQYGTWIQSVSNSVTALGDAWIDVPRSDWGVFQITTAKYTIGNAPPNLFSSITLNDIDINSFLCRKKVIGKTCHLEFKLDYNEINAYSTLPANNLFLGFIFHNFPVAIQPKSGILVVKAYHLSRTSGGSPTYFCDVEMRAVFDTNTPTDKLASEDTNRDLAFYDSSGAPLTIYQQRGASSSFPPVASALITFTATYELP